MKQMRTWAEIDLESLRKNYAELRGRASGSRFLGVVKANAYGHGAVRISRELAEIGADYLGVAALCEALELRDAGISAPILIMGYTPPEWARELISGDFTQSVTDIETARLYSNCAKGIKKPIKIHIKLDTGMSRLGFGMDERSLEEAAMTMALPGLETEGVFTHLAVSDEVSGEEFTLSQVKKFAEAVSEIERAAGRRIEIRHCANSGGVVNYKEAHFDMVRPGIALYGGYSEDARGLKLYPVMSLKTRVSHIREIHGGDSVGYGRSYVAGGHRKIAVLPVGYADGLHRCLSGRIDVLVNGRRAPQTGRICMDMCMVDITHISRCEAGDVATIFGSDGDACVSLGEQASKAGTITYELLCAVSPRVPRVYI